MKWERSVYIKIVWSKRIEKKKKKQQQQQQQAIF